MALNSDGKVLRRADPSTIQDKFLVGYQGWFTCPGDGRPLDPHHHGWLHWFNYPIPNGGRPNTDIWPDVSEYSPSELFPAPGLKLANGEQAFLFSSRNARTVQRHFHWMAQHGVDGAFLQRFAGQCDMEAGNEAIRNQRDEIGDRVREAAEKEGRVFAIMYDVSGVPADRIQRVIEQDWLHLIRNKGVLDSPSYLREKGKPVVTLWGFGFSDSRHSPATVRAITNFIRSNTPGGVYIMAGTPAHWRTSVADADSNPEFVDVWLEEFDAISPWTIGRYSNLDEADRFAEDKMKGDAEMIRKRNENFEMGRGGKRKVDYIPVVFPGGSGFNLSEGKWGFNDIKRQGGNFLWRQLFNARRLNVRTIYGAMWDEYDEGTAFMPVVQNKRQLPVHEKFNFMALDEDGFDLPSDWYMRICGFAVEGLRGERMIHQTFPSKELQDYWSSRPRYEEQPVSSGSGSSAKKDKEGETWEEWDAKGKGKDGSDEPPPPPYTLEDDVPLETLQPTSLPPAAVYSVAVTSNSTSTARQQSPLAPLATRPVIPTSIATAQSSTGTPPPVVRHSRPSSVASSGSSVVTYADPPAVSAVATLTDQFSRQSLSPHPVQPNLATRPTSPPANQATKPHIGPGPNSSSPYQPPPPPGQHQYGGAIPGADQGTNSWTQPSWPGQQQSQASPSQGSAAPQTSYASAYQPSYAPVYGPSSTPSSSTTPGGHPSQASSPYPGAQPQPSSIPPFPSATAPPLQHSQSQPPYLNQTPSVLGSGYPPSTTTGAPPPQGLHHANSISGHHHQHQSSYPGQNLQSPSPSSPPTSYPSPSPPAPHAPYSAVEPGIGGFSFPPAPPQQGYGGYGAQSHYQQPYQQPGGPQYSQYGGAQGGYPVPQPQPGPGGYQYQQPQAPGPGQYGTATANAAVVHGGPPKHAATLPNLPHVHHGSPGTGPGNAHSQSMSVGNGNTFASSVMVASPQAQTPQSSGSYFATAATATTSPGGQGTFVTSPAQVQGGYSVAGSNPGTPGMTSFGQNGSGVGVGSPHHHQQQQQQQQFNQVNNQYQTQTQTQTQNQFGHPQAPTQFQGSTVGVPGVQQQFHQPGLGPGQPNQVQFNQYGQYPHQQQQQQQGGANQGQTAQKYLELAMGFVGLPPPAPDTGRKVVGAVQSSSKRIKENLTDPNTRKKVTGMAQTGGKFFVDGFKEVQKKF